MNNNSQAIALNLPIAKIFKFSLSLKFIGFFTALIILSLLIVCVFQINAYTGEYYLLQEYEGRMSQLAQDGKMLEINFSQANSLNNMGVYVQNQIFEKTDSVEYIRVLESTVLAK